MWIGLWIVSKVFKVLLDKAICESSCNVFIDNIYVVNINFITILVKI